ncbi:hypothetical protein MBLNU459_g3711t2 [Dothideomycetes sp. NU459]
MEYNDQAERIHEQHANPESVDVYDPSGIAARFRQSQPVMANQVLGTSQAANEMEQSYPDASRLSDSMFQGVYQYNPVMTAEEPSHSFYSYQQLQERPHYASELYRNQQSSFVNHTFPEHSIQYPPTGDSRGSISSSLSTPASPRFYEETHSRPTHDTNNFMISRSSDQEPYSHFGYPELYAAGGQGFTTSSQQEYAEDQKHTERLSAGLGSASELYQTRVRQIFTYVNDGQLAPTADLLSQISHYLLGNAQALELHIDKREIREERLQLWEQFNRCWLTTLQRQFDMTSDALAHGRKVPPAPQSLLGADVMEDLGQQLVTLCDGVEKLGLVDYEMGVAEEEISTSELDQSSC